MEVRVNVKGLRGRERPGGQKHPQSLLEAGLGGAPADMQVSRKQQGPVFTGRGECEGVRCARRQLTSPEVYVSLLPAQPQPTSGVVGETNKPSQIPFSELGPQRRDKVVTAPGLSPPTEGADVCWREGSQR